MSRQITCLVVCGTAESLQMASDEAFEAAVAEACKKFGVRDVHVEQRIAVKYLLRRRDVFACFPTGFGKSLIYQIQPSVASSLELRGFPSEPMVVVISPLNSLMRDQVTALQGRGIRAFQVGCSVEDDASIKNGECSIFFGSPELLIGRDEWRLALQESPLKYRVIAVVVDEVHTVIQW